MTYMSIPGALAPLVRSRRLFCLPSAVTGFEIHRTIYASRMVVEALSGPFKSDGFDDHFIEFRAHLDAFLEGAIFTVAEWPHDKPPETMLARVHPVGAEIWDMRSVAPHPGIRCLGSFWEQDTFIALRWDVRETIDWDAEIESFKIDWAALFGSRAPFRWKSLDDYLTNFDAV